MHKLSPSGQGRWASWVCNLCKLLEGPAHVLVASQVALVMKNLTARAGDTRNAGSIPGLGRSPGVVNDIPLQYFYLKNPVDRRAWLTIVHRSQSVGHDRSDLA